MDFIIASTLIILLLTACVRIIVNTGDDVIVDRQRSSQLNHSKSLIRVQTSQPDTTDNDTGGVIE